MARRNHHGQFFVCLYNDELIEAAAMNFLCLAQAVVALLTTFFPPWTLSLKAASKPQAVPDLAFIASRFPQGLLNPSSVVEGNDGALYVTAAGGMNNLGGIIRFGRDGTTTVTHLFQGQEGQPALALLPTEDGSLYGTTESGGTNNLGTLFKISASGDFTILHSFTNAIDSNGVLLDAAQPSSPLILGQDGYLYGLAATAGKNGQGAVYRASPTGEVSIVLDFERQTSLRAPKTLLQAKDGMLYGTTALGPNIPGSNSAGAIFQLTHSGEISIIYLPNESTDGNSPVLLLQGADGALYGGTFGLHAAIFRITTDGQFSVLHSYPHSRGSQKPYTSILALAQATDGNLYGLDDGDGPDDTGTFFIYHIDDGSYAALYNFDYTTGSIVQSLLFSPSAKMFYGVADDAGPGQHGNVFGFSVLNAALLPNQIASVGIENVTMDPSEQTQTFQLSRIGGDINQLLTVGVKFKGSARDGLDFLTVPSSFTLKAGKSSKKFQVVPISSTSKGETVKILIEPGSGYEASDAYIAKGNF